jgi:hypothetical protein
MNSTTNFLQNFDLERLYRTCKLEDKAELLNNCYYVILKKNSTFLIGGTKNEEKTVTFVDDNDSLTIKGEDDEDEGESKVETPELQTPELQTPELQTPELQTPAVETPELQTPAVETPAEKEIRRSLIDQALSRGADWIKSDEGQKYMGNLLNRALPKSPYQSNTYFRPTDEDIVEDVFGIFIFKLNTDGDFNNVDLVSYICDEDRQIISGIFFEKVNDPNKGRRDMDDAHRKFYTRLKLNYEKSMQNDIGSKGTSLNKSELVYEGINNGFINCRRAQLHLNISKIKEKCTLKFEDSFVNNVELINTSIYKNVRSNLYYTELKEHSFLFDSILEFAKNNSVYNIYYCEEIFNFNKYIEDISTLKVKSRVFKSSSKKRGGKRNKKTRRKPFY